MANGKVTIPELGRGQARIEGKLDDLAKSVQEIAEAMASSKTDREGLRRDVDNLGKRVTAWDMGNSVAGAVLAVWVWITQK